MKHTTRIAALCLVLSLVVGVLAVLPISASAFATSDSNVANGTVQGTPLPEGATAYDAATDVTTALDGTGSENDPYLIANAADFVYFRDTATAAADTAAGATATTYFKLTGDIYLNTETYGESGTAHYSLGTAPAFAGVLDGDNHVIYNMYNYGATDIALFGTLTGTVKNLTFDGVRLFANGKAATVCISFDGTMEYITVKNCRIEGKGITAGLAAEANDSTTFNECSVSGFVSSSSSIAAGMLGKSGDTARTGPISFINCTNNATVSAKNSHAAGIVCSVNHNNKVAGVEMTGCTNNGDITGKSNVGGLAGDYYRLVSYVSFDYCTNNGTITSTGSNAGGILGCNSAGTGGCDTPTSMRNCTNNGDVSGATAGGFCGLYNIPSTAGGLNIVNSINFGNVDGTSSAGGFAGKVKGEGWSTDAFLHVTNSASHGDIGSAGTSKIAGGIIGSFNTANSVVKTQGVIVTGNISAIDAAGAIAGQYNITKSPLLMSINSTWVHGTVSATGENGKVAVFAADTIFYNSTGIKKEGSSWEIDHYEYSFKDTSAIAGPHTCTGSGFDVVFSVNNTIVENPAGTYTYELVGEYDILDLDSLAAAISPVPHYGYKDGSTVVNDPTYPTVSADAFASTALASLTTFSETSSDYNSWTADAEHVAVFLIVALQLSNESALTHKYDGTAVEASYFISDRNIKDVTITYFDIAGAEPVQLDNAPAVPGSYRVVLQGYNSAGVAYAAPVVSDYTISKGSVAFTGSDETMLHAKRAEGWTNRTFWLKTFYTGEALACTAKLYQNTDGIAGVVLDAALAPTSISFGNKAVSQVKMPGEYVLTYKYAGSDLYESATATVRIDVQQTISFAGASITLGGNAKLNYYVHKDHLVGYENPVVQLVDANKVATDSVKVGDYYVVSYDIKASEFATVMSLTLKVKDDNGTYSPYHLIYKGWTDNNKVYATIDYSAMDYITNMYLKTEHAEYTSYKPILEAMALYGAEAEAKANGTAVTETAVMAAVTAAGITDLTVPTWTEGYDAYINPNAPLDAAIPVIAKHAAAVGASLTGGISLELSGMTPGNNVYVTTDGLTEKEYTVNEGGVLTITDLHAAMIMSEVTLDFGGGDIAIFTVGNYLNYRMAQDAEGTETALIQATILYMMAAKTYVETVR